MRKIPIFRNVSILAWARDEGPDLLDTSALEGILRPLLSRLRLPEGILGDMTGIRRRCLYPRGSPPSKGAVNAANKLLAETGVKPVELDLIYSTSVGRDFLEPSTASIIQSSLGLSSFSSSLDLGSACLGFMDGLYLAALQVEQGLIELALIVAGENSRMVLESTLERLSDPKASREDFFRNFATLTLGSGGAAMLVGRSSENPSAPKLRRFISLSDPKSNDLCRGGFDGMETDSAMLLTKGVELAKRTFSFGERSFGWHPGYFDLIICHQVSEANTRKFAEALRLPWDRVLKTYPSYGNMGPVAVPFTFAVASETGLLKKGSRIGLMGIGSGLACSMVEAEMP
jgi:3-oxoacyl-[acyl-carrier-protein] synthase-3